MSYKKIMSFIVAISIFVSVIVSPQVASAVWTGDVADEWQDDFGTEYYGNNLYIYNENRANISFEILGTSALDTLTSNADLKPYAWDTTTNKYLWIGISVDHMSQASDLTNLTSFQNVLLYNVNYLTPVQNTTALFNSLLALNPEVANYEYADISMDAYRTDEYNDKQAYEPAYAYSDIYVQYTDADTDLSRYGATLNLKSGQTPIFDDLTTDDGKHLLLALCFEMTGESDPGTDMIVQGYGDATYTALSTDTKSIYYSKFSDKAMVDQTLPYYFNMANLKIEAPKTYSITYNTETYDGTLTGAFDDAGTEKTRTETGIESGNTSAEFTTNTADVRPPAGYTFKGWYTSNDTELTSDTTITENWTVYAKYEVANYTVTYNPGQGTFSDSATTKTETVSGGSNPTLGDGSTQYETLLTPPAGYEFDGWYTKDGTNDDWGSAFTTSSSVSGDMTVYAKYKQGSYTVTYHIANKENSLTGKFISDNSKTTIEETNIPGGTTSQTYATRTSDVEPPFGYEFDGWEDTNGNLFEATTAVTANIDVYAKYKTADVYTLTFKLDGGSINSSTNDYTVSVYKGKSLNDMINASQASDIPTPTKDHYTFEKWDPTFDPSHVYTDSETTVFTAQYTANHVDVTFRDTKTNPSAEADVVYSLLEAKSITETNAAESATFTHTDVPTPAADPDKYVFYGWYTTEINWTDKKASDIDNDPTAIKFTKDTQVATDTTVYAVYVLSDNAKISNAVFYEETVGGTTVPYTDNQYTYPATNATFDPDTNTYYMVVGNTVENAAAEITLDYAGSSMTATGPDGSISLTQTSQSPNTQTFILPLKVAEDKSVNTVTVDVTAPDGTSLQYTFNILRMAKAGIVLGYGNTPAGLIYRDDESFPTETDKETALTKFNSSHSINKKFVAGYVPIVKGSVATGDAVYAQTTKAYTTYAWRRSYSNVNYDLNKYAYVVYQGDKFTGPATYFVDEYGYKHNVTVDFTLKRQTTAGASSYTGNDTTDKVVDITAAGLLNATTQKYQLTSKMIRPDVYTMSYSYTYTPLGASAPIDYSETRPLIVIAKYGDIWLTPSPGVNTLDSRYLLANATKTNTGNSLVAYRIADVWMTPSPGVNTLDSRYLLSNATAINTENFRFYPNIEN